MEQEQRVMVIVQQVRRAFAYIQMALEAGETGPAKVYAICGEELSTEAMEKILEVLEQYRQAGAKSEFTKAGL